MNPTMKPDGGKLTLLVATLNLRGQTRMPLSKLLQLEELLKTIKPAIVFFQESQLQNNTFENCPYINSNFQLLINNSPTGYGTGALINNSLKVDNVKALPVDNVVNIDNVVNFDIVDNVDNVENVDNVDSFDNVDIADNIDNINIVTKKP